MAKATGMGWTTLSVDDATGSLTAIRTDVTNLDFSTPRPMQDITSIDLSAYERLLLLADFSINLSGVFNPTGVQLIFQTLNTGVSRRTNMTVNTSNLNVTGTLYTDYTVKRDNTGTLLWTAAGVLSDGSTPTWS